MCVSVCVCVCVCVRAREIRVILESSHLHIWMYKKYAVGAPSATGLPPIRLPVAGLLQTYLKKISRFIQTFFLYRKAWCTLLQRSFLKKSRFYVKLIFEKG